MLDADGLHYLVRLQLIVGTVPKRMGWWQVIRDRFADPVIPFAFVRWHRHTLAAASRRTV